MAVKKRELLLLGSVLCLCVGYWVFTGNALWQEQPAQNGVYTVRWTKVELWPVPSALSGGEHWLKNSCVLFLAEYWWLVLRSYILFYPSKINRLVLFYPPQSGYTAFI